jgi:hypothetical protein
VDYADQSEDMKAIRENPDEEEAGKLSAIKQKKRSE